MKIASWNINSLRVRLEHVVQWLNDSQPDILCLQELKMPNDQFPVDELLSAGYHSVYNGQKTYNGVAILSKKPLSNVVLNFNDFEDEQKRVIIGTYDGVTIANVYVPNGQDLDSDKFIYKRRWFAKLQSTMDQLLKDNPKTVLVGDFNITANDLDVHDPDKWRDKIHCSKIERLMLQKLMSTGLYDTFRHFNNEAEQYSWWDYRGGGYERNHGLRIDLILSSSAMLDKASSCTIDQTPRKLERPSDHTPVIAQYGKSHH